MNPDNTEKFRNRNHDIDWDDDTEEFVPYDEEDYDMWDDEEDYEDEYE